MVVGCQVVCPVAQPTLHAIRGGWSTMPRLKQRKAERTIVGDRRPETGDWRWDRLCWPASREALDPGASGSEQRLPASAMG